MGGNAQKKFQEGMEKAGSSSGAVYSLICVYRLWCYPTFWPPEIQKSDHLSLNPLCSNDGLALLTLMIVR